MIAALAGVFSLAVAASAVAGQGQSCVITLSLIDQVAINNLDFKVDYSSAGGQIEGSGPTAVCRGALGGAMAAFNDVDATQAIRFSIISLKQFSGQVTLVGCRFSYNVSAPVASDFHISVQVAAQNSEDGNVVPLPRVAVTGIQCPGVLPVPTTTTTSSTTTTTSSTTTSTVPVTTTSAPVTTTTVVAGRCGFPLSDGDRPTASDALYTLRAAVGLAPCASCVCDVDGSTRITASDALAILRNAVGGEVLFTCPACS